ncbi:site-specific DNA-methyltransferase, partial [bacterium]|nr:site-specific DNA-methyltransferase [bacterium]
KDSGHYHSNWLSMMYPRLFLARNLLREDGVIAVSIDDNEVHNLRMLMNEVFGEENFLAQITIITGANQSGEGIQFQKNTEYSIVYSKTAKSDCIIRKDKVNESYRNLNDAPSSLETREEMGYTIYYNKETKEIIPLKDYDKSKISTNDINQVYTDDVELIQKGFIPIRPGIRNKKLHRWRWGIETFKARINEIVIFEKDDNFKVVFKQEGLNPPKSYLNFGGGAAELKEIFDDDIFFDYPKSYKYLKYLVSIGCGKNDIVLDFFSGSSTTAHAVLDLNKEDDDNRQFIMVQMPEACDEKSEVYKAGYKTIADIGKERIRRVIKNIEKEKESKLDLDDHKQDLGFKVFKLRKSNFKIWRTDTIENGEELKKQLDSFKDLVGADADTENMLYELLLKSGVELTAEIEKKDGFFLVNGELIVALERMDEKLVKTILSEKPTKIITLDRLFESNDPLKTNTVLQMKDTGVEFKTI